MITGLFINSCILITFLTIYHHYTKNKDIEVNSSLSFKILLGAGGGLLGILLMTFSVQVTSKIITDFRAIPILLCSIYVGILPSIIATLIIASFRIIHFGVTDASIIAVIDIILMGIGFSFINLKKINIKRKWIYCVVYLLILNTIPMIILVKDVSFLIEIFALYMVSNMLMCYFIFTYVEYLNESIKLYKKFKNEATIDYLTGVNNVRQFDIVFNKVAQKAVRDGEHLSLLFLDIDYFKKVNDTYGHYSGDIILKDIAAILQDTCRGYDMISRNGGEEFSVLLLNCKSEDAFIVAERIRKNVFEYKFYVSNNNSINITVSVGISTYPNLTDNLEDLLVNADTALYEAKKRGRNKVVLYNKNEEDKV